MLVGNHTNLGRTGRHVDSYVVQTYLLLGSHDVLVARTEDLVDLGYRLCTVGHRTDSLYATSLENLADTCNAGSYKDGGINLTLTVWRGAEHDLTASSDLCWGSQHEYRREEWGSATWNIETNLLNGYALLPANNTWLCLYLLALELLSFVESLDVIVSHLDGSLQFRAYQLFCFVHLGLCHCKRRQIDMIELQLIALYGIVATLLHISQYRGYRLVQLGCVKMGSLHYLRPITSFRKTNDIHFYLLTFLPFYLLQYHFLNWRYQNTLGTHLLQFADDLPELLLVEHCVYGTPLFVGQRNDRRALQTRQHIDDLLQTSLRRIHAYIFLILGIFHSLEAEQHLFEDQSLLFTELLIANEQGLAPHHNLYFAQVIADEG